MSNQFDPAIDPGKSLHGIHTPFTCPFCGPDPNGYIPEADIIEISYEQHVQIPTSDWR